MQDLVDDELVEILIVDDREENLLALDAALRSSDYRLVRASSGEKALRHLLDNKPALILMDVQMPKMDGYETAALVKGSDRTRDIPIIFLTALNEEERLVQKGYESGAVDYVTKPFNAEILRSKVRVFAELHRKTQRLLKFEREIRKTEGRERERKLAELELRSLRREQIQQRKYQDLVQGIDHGIVWAASPGMSFSYVSPTAEKLLGYSQEQWLGETGFWANHMHPDDVGAFFSRCRRAIDEQSGFSMEHRFLTAEEKTVWLQTGIRVNPGLEAGEVELHGLSVDISLIKEAETLMKISKQRSEVLAQASLVLANSFDVKVTVSNVAKLIVPSLADWFSVEVVSNGRGETICLEHLKTAEKNTLKSTMTVPIQIQGCRLGTLVIGSASREGAFDDGDLGFMSSIACRVATALESARLYDEAKKAVLIRDEFLSIASHELKTPLTPLKLQIQQLLRLLPKSKDVDQDMISKLLGMSNRQITRLSRLIEDLLDISHINRGRLQLELEDFSLVALIRDVVQRFDRQLEEAGCKISFEFGEFLPVHWDQFRTEQVLVNLLANAIKYAPGKPIHIRAGVNGANVFFSIRDEGIGIAHEDQERIFKRFERAVSRSHFGGLGLGLYIVSQIIDRHEGTIHVESEAGKGATFLVEMPANGPRDPNSDEVVTISQAQ